MKKEELGIYIHIPFCKRKCYYCDFISFCDKDEEIEEYVECLKSEIDNLKEKYDFSKYDITTLYIGGGTPSYIDSKYIGSILESISKNIKTINKIKEVTIEANPGTLTDTKLRDYKRYGINRLSIGLQSTKDDLLKEIGRIHNFEKFLNNYNLARKLGFDNINVDLMLGLPNQKIEDLKDSIEKIISLSPEHISVYSLILEEETKLYKMINDGKTNLPDEELERNMYWYVKDKLELAGYNHYEISNFAKKGFESKHNLNCWNQKQYIGIGVAAHSYMKNKRFSNTVNLKEYIKNIKASEFEKNIMIEEIQDDKSKKEEYMLLSLRKLEGVNIQNFKNEFTDNPIYLFKEKLEKLVKEGLIEIDGNFIKLTNKGLDLANIVWEEFV